MAWKLSGQLIEVCSCTMFCPCWFGIADLMKMDRGWCAGTLTFRIKEGQSNGVDLGKQTLVLTAHWPGPTLFDGNGTARIYVDRGASAEQKRELEAIFQGKKGGPITVLAGFISTWLPTESARIDVQETGDALKVNVEGAGEIHSKLLRDESGRAMTLHNCGFASALSLDDLTISLAPSAGTRMSPPGLPHSYEADSGARATLRWSA